MGKKGLQKSLKIYFSKLKRVPSRNHTSSKSNAPSRLLSACKYPKTPSFIAARRNPAAAAAAETDDHRAAAATLSDVDRFLYENFHSLYIRDDGPPNPSSPSPPLYDDDGGGNDSDDIDDDDILPRRGAFRSSERFFVSPGTSSSLAEDSSGPSETGPVVPGGGVAVTTFTKDPYEDFRRSMKDMVDARHVDAPRRPLDWDFMEELLFCYLELNDKAVHKYILRAFTDLAAGFQGPAERGRRRRGSSGGVTSFSGHRAA